MGLGQPPPRGRDDSGWPFAAFKDSANWKEDVGEFDTANAGLRHGLAVAFARMVEQERGELPRESEADVLITAIFCMQEMRRQFDEELAWLIAEARYKGVSWGKIASALEMTRQAAHKRFKAGVDFIFDYRVPERRRLLERLGRLDPPREGSPPG
jgi:hypothetical protein